MGPIITRYWSRTRWLFSSFYWRYDTSNKQMSRSWGTLFQKTDTTTWEVLLSRLPEVLDESEEKKKDWRTIETIWKYGSKVSFLSWKRKWFICGLWCWFESRSVDNVVHSVGQYTFILLCFEVCFFWRCRKEETHEGEVI